MCMMIMILVIMEKKDEKHVNKDENSFEYYQYNRSNDDSNVNNLFTIPGYR